MTSVLEAAKHLLHIGEKPEAPTNNTEVAATLETEATPTAQPAELGHTAVATTEIAGLITAPIDTSTVEAPVASTEQPSDTQALASAEKAINGSSTDTFTVPATSQEIASAAPFQASQVEKSAAELQTSQTEAPATYPQSPEVAGHEAAQNAITAFENDITSTPPVETVEPVTTELASVDVSAEEEDTFATSEDPTKSIVESEIEAKGEN